MNSENFKKIFDKNSDATYNPQKTAEILKAFNLAISSLYFLDGDERYISEVLNTSISEDEECKKIYDSIGIRLCDIADKLELVRSILFGGCLDWDFIRIELEKLQNK
jgi:hypothetical protein